MLEILPARLRIVIVAFLLPIAAFFGLWAVGALSNLWADYKDSSDSTYLIVGGAFSLLALAILAVVFLVLRDANSTTRFQGLAAGLLLTAAGGTFLLVLASTPPSFDDGAQPVPASRPPANAPSAPLATPSIATPESQR